MNLILLESMNTCSKLLLYNSEHNSNLKLLKLWLEKNHLKIKSHH